MDVEQVVQKILSDAQGQADQIKNQADQTQSAEKAELDRQLEDYARQTEVMAQKAGEDEKSHILAAVRMEIAKELLAEKRKVLAEVFEQVKQQLQNLPAEPYYDFVTRLMLNAVETGDEEVLIGPNETRIDPNFVKNINRQLGPGYKGNLRFSEQRVGISGGFFLRRGKIKTNVSFDVLVDQARNELEMELAKDLF